MIVNIDVSQEIFAIDMLRALKSSLKHRRKHVLRPLQLYGDQGSAAQMLNRGSHVQGSEAIKRLLDDNVRYGLTLDQPVQEAEDI